MDDVTWIFCWFYMDGNKYHVSGKCFKEDPMKNRTIINTYSGWLIGDAVIDAVKGISAYLFATYNPTARREVIDITNRRNMQSAIRPSYAYSAACISGGYF
ncbi:MAG: hypothetical protein IPO83_06910 [Chitinophagaceae bacterium]|nr:hypothetical protein [Chitinophagaceae bacterium]